ncbi:BlaI/MecI/CopY family transcriptional regulator [Marihabitans asiaticum]|uniref:Putative transcriptional regulator n=1 Tax=Marihabitans asiaticum TaxID=415218 RepID=A0A560WE41_9MICO|nr:BlaI/MecI/CopY family transcriptional regulator [Marihabitans asiaticum]TWD15898.1 putative transcriptional regulator [Marihabitans asiaticum]
MPNSRSSLGSLERSVMDVIWDDPAAKGLTVREVLDRLQTKRPLAYTTVMTVLSRLAEKGTLERTRDGRAWRYRTTTTRQQLTAEAMRDPLGELDQEQRTSAILHFIEDATEDELASLRAALDAVEVRAAGEHGATPSS